MRWLIPLVMVCTFARPARADLASSIYGDVQNVIEELIQTEVTQSVTRTIGHSSPALGYYMNSTLERLASPYWGSLGRVLKDDLTVLVADFVYWHISTGGGDGDILGSAKRFFNCAKPGEAWNPLHCGRLIDAIQKQKRPLIEVECRRAKPKADRRIACNLGLAVLAALKGRGEVRQHLVDALAEITLLEIAEKDVGARMRDVLTKWMDLPKDLPTPLLEALGDPGLAQHLTDAALDKRCSDPEELKKAIDNPYSAFSWLCFAVTHKKIEPLLEATVTVKEGAHAFKQAVPHWRIAQALEEVDGDRADDELIYRLFAELAWERQCPTSNAEAGWPCAGKRLDSGAQLTVDWLGRSGVTVTFAAGKMTGAPQRYLLAPALKFRRLARRITELRVLVPPSLTNMLFYAGQSVSPDTKAVLRAAHRMARLVVELRQRWYLWQSQNKSKSFEELDVTEILQVARNSLDKTTIEANAALAFLDKEAEGGAATLDIGDWLRMVMRADYRSLAMESLRAALDISLTETNRPHETFFLSLAAYLLDNTEGVGEQVARSAFRASAKQLLLSATKRGVPRSDDRWRFRLLPRISVRLAFNDDYAVTGDKSRRRTVAADWPTAMVAINDFIGFEISLIDFVAPLGELALRKQANYEHSEYVALDLLRPRLGVWVAVPQFSRRLALSAGFGARFVSVSAADTVDSMPLIYDVKPSLAFDVGLGFVF